jgi:hypothetical protein
MPAGSLVLFGSHLDGQFVLDTVFVVGSRTSFIVGEPGELYEDISPAFRVATLDPLSNNARLRGLTAQLYRAVAYCDDGRHDMYSFAPARADGARFSRPVLRRSRFINPGLTQNFKITPASREEVLAVWNDAVAQVQSKGLDLGIEFAEPKILPDDPTGQDSTADLASICSSRHPGSANCAPIPAPAKRFC